MNCPHCQSELSAAEVAALLAGMRKTHGGGRPIYQRCFCGVYTMPQLSRKSADLQDRHTQTFCVRLGVGRPKLVKTD